ncbi:MAG: CRAL/TRIO, N-terminal domain-containing protein [Olpidium bornovanus]|uniref:CRAL/TRIO, N-terminal domain-containing protein n=1 Tax=Olpidium bornovanus TaxID=278681 RepID=A0A8H8DLU4_9FUNG|nr:MAG: CRAL/TRIO, N-terminal domain-containing protein [Olpidium bornovanus]
MSGQVAPPDITQLTPEQKSKLEQFRKELEAEGLYNPLEPSDTCLIRFLRARKWDLPKTMLMFKNAEQWRKDFGVDQLVKDFRFDELPQVQEIYPRYYHKTDRLGMALRGKKSQAVCSRLRANLRRCSRSHIAFPESRSGRPSWPI